MRYKHFLIVLLVLVLSLSFVNASDNDVVRVGYYENEVFQEGAEEGAVKNLDEFFEYFAKHTNYSVETIRKWRKGENTPSGLEDIKCIASFLGIEYTSLFPMHYDMKWQLL